jgi:hypothetical protein
LPNIPQHNPQHIPQHIPHNEQQQTAFVGAQHPQRLAKKKPESNQNATRKQTESNQQLATYSTIYSTTYSRTYPTADSIRRITTATAKSKQPKSNQNATTTYSTTLILPSFAATIPLLSQYYQPDTIQLHIPQHLPHHVPHHVPQHIPQHIPQLMPHQRAFVGA